MGYREVHVACIMQVIPPAGTFTAAVRFVALSTSENAANCQQTNTHLALILASAAVPGGPYHQLHWLCAVSICLTLCMHCK